MVCLDTTFLLDLIKDKKEAVDLANEMVEKSMNICIASPSIMELVKGLYLKENLKHIKEGEKERISNIITSFNILNLDKESAIKSGVIDAELNNSGEIIDLEDIMISAICIRNNEPLITRNTKHFNKIKELKVDSY